MHRTDTYTFARVSDRSHSLESMKILTSNYGVKRREKQKKRAANNNSSSSSHYSRSKNSTRLKNHTNNSNNFLYYERKEQRANIMNTEKNICEKYILFFSLRLWKQKYVLLRGSWVVLFYFEMIAFMMSDRVCLCVCLFARSIAWASWLTATVVVFVLVKCARAAHNHRCFF